MSVINCPYCDAKDVVGDAWELGTGESHVECNECEKEFVVYGEAYLEFTSMRAECDEGDHNFDEWELFSKDSVGYVRYYRVCEHCNKFDWGEKLPIGSPLPDHLKAA